MLTNEKKHQIFQKLRAENYQASLRLEGIGQRTTSDDKCIAARVELKRKTRNAR